ncbi:hypothetical protein C8R47DRAFT_974024 [Mycena vitilis]|nr:hypothetical protein C8R47DRAFT_974024 [Mycena vitilis]
MEGEDTEDATVTGDRGIYLSADGNRRNEELLNQSHKKRRLKVKPSSLHDSLAQWIPVDNDADGETELLDSVSSAKRKRYTSSDDPMAEWRPHAQLYLDETVRMHGLGDNMRSPACALCAIPLDDTPFFRCRECGVFLQCKACCLHHHRFSPLHLLSEWKQDHWQGTTLEKLGLIFQLGHEGGPCPTPAAVVRRMVVIDTSGIHEVSYRFCACKRKEHANMIQQLLRTGWWPATVTRPGTCATWRVLDFFRSMNVVGNVNASDFITGLERLTDARVTSGMVSIPVCYPSYVERDYSIHPRIVTSIRMARQYAFVQRGRRAARAHNPAGLAATEPGEMLPKCWPCPFEGRNLPEGWRDVDPKFLYMLLLAIDANFKLKNRKPTNEIDDPSLGPGWGAFVEPTKYKEHLSKYIAEKDISSCIAFAALLQKDTRNTTGLRCSGVGGCVCARHEVMRPNGLGDLQKGERYSNIDYIVMSALRGFSLEQLTLSYDIACQWKKNLPDRMEKLPVSIQLALDEIELQCGLPVWHASSHDNACQDENSLSFLVGVGKSDGEGVERFWAILNQIAYFTKDAGMGTRADAVEDKIDAHNFLKNLGQGDALLRKLIIAVAERARQVEAFKVVNKTIDTVTRAVVAKYVSGYSQANSLNAFLDTDPFVDGPTEAEIRRDLQQDEERDARARGAPLHATSATAFLVAGIQLENTQRRMKAQFATHSLVTADREVKLQDMRRTFFTKLKKFRELQGIYTPAALRAVAAEEKRRDVDAEPQNAEKVKLWFPSELPEATRVEGCLAGVAGMEARMREGQCANALVELRSRLHTKRHLIGFRDSNITGQVKSTKARTLIGQIGDRANATAARYRRAREALTALKGPGYAPQFRELKQEDMTLDGEVADEDVVARKKLAMAGAGKKGRMPRHIDGSSKKVLSWIWTAAGMTLSSDDTKAQAALHESVRVEWSRAQARKIRWEEEVALIREEMRRVLRYLDWQVRWWKERQETSTPMAEELRAGLRAYAVEQAIMHQQIADFFRTRWSQSIREAAQSVLASEEGAELNEFFGQGARRADS